MKWNEMKWNEMKWNEMKWNEMKWNKTTNKQTKTKTVDAETVFTTYYVINNLAFLVKVFPDTLPLTFDANKEKFTKDLGRIRVTIPVPLAW